MLEMPSPEGKRAAKAYTEAIYQLGQAKQAGQVSEGLTTAQEALTAYHNAGGTDPYVSMALYRKIVEAHSRKHELEALEYIFLTEINLEPIEDNALAACADAEQEQAVQTFFTELRQLLSCIDPCKNI